MLSCCASCHTLALLLEPAALSPAIHVNSILVLITLTFSFSYSQLLCLLPHLPTLLLEPAAVSRAIVCQFVYTSVVLLTSALNHNWLLVPPSKRTCYTPSSSFIDSLAQLYQLHIQVCFAPGMHCCCASFCTYSQSLNLQRSARSHGPCG